MTGSRLVEESGAQVLPPVGGQERQTVIGWVAWLCVSADQRAKFPEFRELAGRLLVEAVAK